MIMLIQTKQSIPYNVDEHIIFASDETRWMKRYLNEKRLYFHVIIPNELYKKHLKRLTAETSS